MTTPDWLKPGLYGAAIGAIALSIIGFSSWGGWMTESSADKMARAMAQEETTAALVPTCLAMSQADPDRIAKLATIQNARGYNRGQAVMDAGWATAPGMDAPDRELAKACVTAMQLDAS